VKPNALTLIGFGPEGRGLLLSIFHTTVFHGVPEILVGVLSVGLVSDSYQTEAYRAAYQPAGPMTQREERS
jgi:ABC-type arginine transport system permease subunit